MESQDSCVVLKPYSFMFPIVYQLGVTEDVDMKTKLKITVMKKFSPEEIFGHKIMREGNPIQPCSYAVGDEFIVDDHLNRPKNFCGQAWQDLYDTLMIYYCGGDYNYPEPGVTYQPCGDGIRPVIFKIEKMSE